MTRWYHCVTRCVRRAFLLGEGPHDRKEWIENRLEELAQIFAAAIGGFSVLDNHLHLLLRLDPDVANGWSDGEVVRRWGRLFPPRDKSRQPLPVTNDWVQWRLTDVRGVATARERLQSLSWFMKCLKEPLSRLANPQDQTRGTFFEGRFKSVAILDQERNGHALRTRPRCGRTSAAFRLMSFWCQSLRCRISRRKRPMRATTPMSAHCVSIASSLPSQLEFPPYPRDLPSGACRAPIPSPFPRHRGPDRVQYIFRRAGNDQGRRHRRLSSGK